MKKIKRIAKIELVGGKAKPGPVLASLGINMPMFCRDFNAQTQNRVDQIVPVLIKIYIDKSFDFVLKTTPTAILLKQAAKITKGAANSKTEAVGEISSEQLKKIAQQKIPDLNTSSLTKACAIVCGTARQMGIKVKHDTT